MPTAPAALSAATSADDPPDRRVEEVAAAQHGVISRAQALAAGLGPARIRRLIDSGRWRQVAPSVYSFPGHPDTRERRLWIAHLHAGPHSVISHRSAVRLHRLGPIEGDPVDLIVGRGQRRALRGTRRFQLDDLAPTHVTSIGGLPLTTPARTIVDAASVLTLVRLERIVENAEVTGQCPVAKVAVTVDELRRRGKPGVRRLMVVLDRLGPAEQFPHSELERYCDRVIDLAGLPTPVHEHPLPGGHGLSGFVDRTWPEARLIVEADGRRWHTRRSQIALDHDRDLAAAQAGYQIVRLIWERLTQDADATAAALRRIYDQRVALLARAGSRSAQRHG